MPSLVGAERLAPCEGAAEGGQDDLYIASQLLWRPRPGVMRVVHRALESRDVLELAEVARAEPLADAILVEGALGDDPLPTDDAVHVIRAEELVSRIQASPLVEWIEGRPSTAMNRLALALDLSEIAPALDPVGLRWLPTLSLNSLPAELEGLGTANDLFEDITFRLLTTALRLGGRRLGSRQRGRRVPDGVLRWREQDRTLSALLDCKAAQYGYRMDIEDQRALVEYVNALREQETEAGFELAYVLIISSEFEGESGDGHPFNDRAAAVLRETGGANLVYLRASDVVQLVLAVERDRAEPQQREQMPWSQLFGRGMPSSDDVAAMWPRET